MVNHIFNLPKKTNYEKYSSCQSCVKSLKECHISKNINVVNHVPNLSKNIIFETKLNNLTWLSIVSDHLLIKYILLKHTRLDFLLLFLFELVSSIETEFCLDKFSSEVVGDKEREKGTLMLD